MKNLLILLVVAVAGCTSPSTKMAIQNYREAEQHKQLSFNNAYRIANQQMSLNLIQYIRLNKDNPESIINGVMATWEARNQLEESRVQFLYSRTLTMVTVGQYLYDKQGVLNVWVEGKSDMLSLTSESLNAAKESSGISIKDIAKLADPTTRPATVSDFDKIFNELSKP